MALRIVAVTSIEAAAAEAVAAALPGRLIKQIRKHFSLHIVRKRAQHGSLFASHTL
jgi:hypothetical protein